MENVRKSWSVLKLLGIVALAISSFLTPLDVSRAEELIYFDEGQGGVRGLFNFDTNTGISTFRTGVPGFNRYFSWDIKPDDREAFTIDFATGNLVRINIDNGAVRVIGPTVGSLTVALGLARDPLTGDLFITDNIWGNNNLYQVDPSNGSSLIIGSTGLFLRGLVFCPDRTLYGFSDQTELYTVDTTTGTATFLGGSPLPFDSVTEDSHCLPDGRLFVTRFNGEIYEVARPSGHLTLIGNTNLGNGLIGLIADPGLATVNVSIDIKPGSEPNSINLSSAGVIPVAILSSETFDALTVDAETIFLGSAGVKMAGMSDKLMCHEEDVNSDGLDDLVCQIETAFFMIEEGEGTAELTAETIDGTSIQGTDSIRIVPD